jgi:hypothetical protein
VLDLYESTIKQERKTIAKRQAKRKASEPDSESDESDSDVSVHILETVNGKNVQTLSTLKKRTFPNVQKPKPLN